MWVFLFVFLEDVFLRTSASGAVASVPLLEVLVADDDGGGGSGATCG